MCPDATPVRDHPYNQPCYTRLMDRPPNASELLDRIRILFGVVPPDDNLLPADSPYSASEDIQNFDIPIPARCEDPVDAVEALHAWLATPNPSFGGLCPKNLINGTDDERAFVASFLSSVSDGSFS